MLEAIRSFLEPPITADPGQSAARLAWVVRLRWLALGAQLLSIIPALEFEVLEREMVPIFLSVVAALALLNTVTWGALRRPMETHPGHVFFQLAADIAALSALLALTGGAWNPLMPILFVHMGLGALLLEGRLSLFLFVLLLACIGFNQTVARIPPGLEGSLLPSYLLFPAQYTVAGVFWILTVWLSRTLLALQAHFSFLSERKTRIDRLRAVGALAAGLSHEFATPLNTAKLKLARLARTRDLEEDSDWATAAEALERCEEILRRMAGSQLEPDGVLLEPVDVARMVERMCDSARETNHGQVGGNIRFSNTLRSHRRALLPAVAFSHAILNLLDNARESTQGEDEIHVVVSSRGGHVEIAVLDRGPGWPDVVRKHFGEPFITTKPDGVGLGLYYVHNLCEAIGADFTLEDRDDGGAEARITLPAPIPAAETTIA
ncbi:MAG: HAMP domain-containing sensor histidine kinase [Myxococcota bacterium]|jgi:two-component system sensor histidine kinase RegB|nr:HAMP domain-containing sensor histidine kinase [Myxococcota bacterium]